MDLYSDSIWKNLEPNISTEYPKRMIGPAPICGPCSKNARNAAKLRETSVMPNCSELRHSSETIVSTTPLGPERSRRIRSSDAPRRPHGTKDSMPTTLSLGVPSSMTASTSRHSSSARSPSRDSAIAKPRSSSVSRHSFARAMTFCISASSMSACRRMRTVTPARRVRVTACRTAFIAGPLRLYSRVWMIASSPMFRVTKPAAW